VLALSTLVTPVAVQATAPVPGSPSSPKPLRDTLIGACIGLIIGVLISFLRSAVDRRLVDANDVGEAMQLPMLGHVHADTLGIGRAGEDGHARFDGQDMETFRMLRQSVDHLSEQHGGRILVTSSTPSEGKSTLALGLALVNAAVGKRTLLVECDLRRPVLAARLGLRSGPGLAQYLAGHADAPDILQPYAISHAFDAPSGDPRSITCIVAGSHATEPAELLGSERFAEFITEVAEVYDVVVVDSTPLLSVVDALELAAHCDRIVMCVRAHQTTRQEAIAGATTLGRVPTKPTGVIITGIGKHDAGTYGYYSYPGLYTDTEPTQNGTTPTPIPN
jgi:capsular exopolysaccharide synthesis family protein